MPPRQGGCDWHPPKDWSTIERQLLFSDCEACDELVMEGCALHSLVMAPNCVPEDESLVGEPRCVALYRSGVNGSKVGAHAMRDLPRDVLFGPLLTEESRDDEREAVGRRSSQWMQVRSRVGFMIERYLSSHYYCIDCHMKTSFAVYSEHKSDEGCQLDFV